MIDDAVRRAVLALFPVDRPLVVYTTHPAFYVAAKAERPALYVVGLGPGSDDLPVTNAGHVVVEGLDDLADPHALLAALRAAMPHARLFALVANAAHARALAAFISGESLALWHPLTREELPELLARAGWTTLAMESLADPTLPDAMTFPSELSGGAVTFTVPDAATLERLRTRALLAVTAAA